MAPGQYITDTILEKRKTDQANEEVQQLLINVQMDSGPCRQVNEEVDDNAKKAAEGATSTKKDLPPLSQKKLKLNKLALKQHRNS